MIGKVILGLFCILIFAFLGSCVLEFLIETPKQLKRIADALEKEQKAGDSK